MMQQIEQEGNIVNSSQKEIYLYFISGAIQFLQKQQKNVQK